MARICPSCNASFPLHAASRHLSWILLLTQRQRQSGGALQPATRVTIKDLLARRHSTHTWAVAPPITFLGGVVHTSDNQFRSHVSPIPAQFQYFKDKSEKEDRFLGDIWHDLRDSKCRIHPRCPNDFVDFFRKWIPRGDFWMETRWWQQANHVMSCLAALWCLFYVGW